MVLTLLTLVAAIALYLAFKNAGEARRSKVEETAARVTRDRLPREMVECPKCTVFRSEDDLADCGLRGCPYPAAGAPQGAESGEKHGGPTAG